MSLALSPIIGTIRVLPAAGENSLPHERDDSTLELWLEGFAQNDALDSSPAEIRLIACTRLSRLALADPAIGVRANLAQLLDDLRVEYDHVSRREAC